MFFFEPLNENRLDCDWIEKCKHSFKKDRPKIRTESTFIAKIKGETKTGLAIAVQLLKISLC